MRPGAVAFFGNEVNVLAALLALRVLTGFEGFVDVLAALPVVLIDRVPALGTEVPGHLLRYRNLGIERLPHPGQHLNRGSATILGLRDDLANTGQPAGSVPVDVTHMLTKRIWPSLLLGRSAAC